MCVLFVSSVQNKVSLNWDTTLVLSESDVILHQLYVLYCHAFVTVFVLCD